MNSDYSHPSHHTIRHNPPDKDYVELTEGGSVSKKRKTSTSTKGKVKRNVGLVHTDSMTTEGTSVAGDVSILTLHSFILLVSFCSFLASSPIIFLTGQAWIVLVHPMVEAQF